MSIVFEKTGILTTVQDTGRIGNRRLGINPSGVMDPTAARLANLIVGNDETEAVIEMHFPASRVRFETDVIFAVCGADFGPHLDGTLVKNWTPIFASAGSLLTFPECIFGARACLSIAGGMAIDEWRGSRSTNLAAGVGGFNGRKLVDKDRIKLVDNHFPHKDHPGTVSSSLIPRYSRFPTVRIVAGAEFDRLTEKEQQKLTSLNFSISAASNRMGFRLDGEALRLSTTKEMLSSAVTFGTIQLLPDGQLVVLMADHQTSGGYPRLANVVSHDLPLLAQLTANDKVAFHLISVAEAEQLALDHERELSFFRVGCKFQAKSWQQ